jgi:hypothetical protein
MSFESPIRSVFLVFEKVFNSFLTTDNEVLPHAICYSRHAREAFMSSKTKAHDSSERSSSANRWQAEVGSVLEPLCLRRRTLS